jgi:hypothetical protein
MADCIRKFSQTVIKFSQINTHLIKQLLLFMWRSQKRIQNQQRLLFSLSPGGAGGMTWTVEPTTCRYGNMARGGHGVSNVLLGHTVLYPSMPCLTVVSGVARPQAGSLWPSFTALDSPRRTPMRRLNCNILTTTGHHF